jgi:spermidine synthase
VVPWQLLDRAQVPGDTGELRLYARGAEFSIRVGREELMNSRTYASEDALSEIGCARVKDRAQPRVLIGGLGMGYSVRSALAALPDDAEVVVAELVPAVISWNRERFGHLAGHPLRDRRVTLRQADVAGVIREQPRAYDAVLLDVDNGPEGLTRKGNDWLYAGAGLAAARAALRPSGVLGIWSAGPNSSFVRRLQRAGFRVDEVTVKARGRGKGSRHTLWLATPAAAKATVPTRAQRNPPR